MLQMGIYLCTSMNTEEPRWLRYTILKCVCKKENILAKGNSAKILQEMILDGPQFLSNLH